MAESMTGQTAEQAFDTPGLRRALGARAHVGAILEHRDGLVFVDTAQGLRLPAGIKLEPASDPASLRGVLAKLGLNAHLDFLFAVFEASDARQPGVHIYYRGRVIHTGSPWFDDSIRFVPLGQIPWHDIADAAVR